MQYRKLTKAQQGRGWAHDKTRARLIHNHTDGTPCWWCGKPMYRDAKLNWDKRALHADHSKALGQYGAHNNLADRGPDPRKVDTSGVSYAAWVSVADVSASKSLGARRLHQECRLRVL